MLDTYNDYWMNMSSTDEFTNLVEETTLFKQNYPKYMLVVIKDLHNLDSVCSYYQFHDNKPKTDVEILDLRQRDIEYPLEYLTIFEDEIQVFLKAIEELNKVDDYERFIYLKASIENYLSKLRKTGKKFADTYTLNYV